jgi:hypothetical protein
MPDQTEYTPDYWGDAAGVLGSVGSGAAAGATLGGPIGGIIGGVAGLGLGIAGTISDEKQRKEAVQAENELQSQLADKSTMQSRMREVGAANAAQSRNAQIDAERTAVRSGLIGGGASEFAQSAKEGVAQAQASTLPALANQVNTDEITRRQEVMNQMYNRQQLLSQQAGGSAMANVGNVAGQVYSVADAAKRAQDPVNPQGQNFGAVADKISAGAKAVAPKTKTPGVNAAAEAAKISPEAAAITGQVLPGVMNISIPTNGKDAWAQFRLMYRNSTVDSPEFRQYVTLLPINVRDEMMSR